jgi:hypothetical protein
MGVICLVICITTALPGTVAFASGASPQAASSPLPAADAQQLSGSNTTSQIVLSNLTISPSTANISERVTISARARNQGGTAATYNTSLRVDNEVVTTTTGTLAPNTSTRITFETTFSEPGTHTVGIDGAGTGTLSIVWGPSITVTGPAVPLAASLDDDVKQVRNQTNASLPSQAFVVTTDTKLFLVFAERGAPNGSATIHAQQLEQTVTERNHTLQVLVVPEQSPTQVVTPDAVGTPRVDFADVVSPQRGLQTTLTVSTENIRVLAVGGIPESWQITRDDTLQDCGISSCEVFYSVSLSSGDLAGDLADGVITTISSQIPFGLGFVIEPALSPLEPILENIFDVVLSNVLGIFGIEDTKLALWASILGEQSTATVSIPIEIPNDAPQHAGSLFAQGVDTNLQSALDSVRISVGEDLSDISTPPAAYDVAPSSGETIWAGQTIVVNDPTRAGEDVILYAADTDGKPSFGEQVTTLSLNAEGEATYTFGAQAADTSHVLATSTEHPLRPADGNVTTVTTDSPLADQIESASFNVRRQELGANFETSTVPETGTDTMRTLSIDSNRDQYQIELSADGLDESQLQQIFNVQTAADAGAGLDGNSIGTFTDNGQAYVRLDASATTAIQADFETIPPGTYSFELQVADTGGLDTTQATMTVNADGSDESSSPASGITLDATVKASGQPGGQAQVQYALRNTSEQNSVTLNLTQIPGMLTINESASNFDGGTYSPSEQAVLWFQPTDTPRPVLAFDIEPSARADQTFTIEATAVDQDGNVTDRLQTEVGDVATSVPAQYDTNGNGQVDLGEVRTGINDFAAGSLGIEDVRTLINYWARSTSI